MQWPLFYFPQAAPWARNASVPRPCLAMRVPWAQCLDALTLELLCGSGSRRNESGRSSCSSPFRPHHSAEKVVSTTGHTTAGMAACESLAAMFARGHRTDVPKSQPAEPGPQTYAKARRTEAAAEPAAGGHLYKRYLCTFFSTTGSCRRGADCTFAHGPEELRDGSAAPGTARPAGQPPAGAVPAWVAARVGSARPLVMRTLGLIPEDRHRAAARPLLCHSRACPAYVPSREPPQGYMGRRYAAPHDMLATGGNELPRCQAEIVVPPFPSVFPQTYTQVCTHTYIVNV